MQIKRKLKYPVWKIPYFLIKSFLVFIKIIRTGILALLIENKYFNKQIELILKILNFIFGNNDQKEIGKKLSNVLTVSFSLISACTTADQKLVSSRHTKSWLDKSFTGFFPLT